LNTDFFIILCELYWDITAVVKCVNEIRAGEWNNTIQRILCTARWGIWRSHPSLWGALAF